MYDQKREGESELVSELHLLRVEMRILSPVSEVHMKRFAINLYALAVIAGGGAFLMATPAQADHGPQHCCESTFGAECCGDESCSAGVFTCEAQLQ